MINFYNNEIVNGVLVLWGEKCFLNKLPQITSFYNSKIFACSPGSAPVSAAILASFFKAKMTCSLTVQDIDSQRNGFMVSQNQMV